MREILPLNSNMQVSASDSCGHALRYLQHLRIILFTFGALDVPTLLSFRSKASAESGIENLKGRPLALTHLGQSRMTLLETTIVEQARHELQNLRCALLLPEGPARTSKISSSFWMLNGLTMLATLANSGLGESAAEELHAIDRDAGQAIAAASLVGLIKKDTPN